MIKLLIVDDEPLAQVGIKSMLNWSELGIAEPLLASNGEIALSLIQENRPEIVITDIKMPKMSGLELAKACKEEFGKLPVFIILTNFEDFHLARESLSYEVVDYLVKLELDADILKEAVMSALTRVEEYNAKYKPMGITTINMLQFKERFFIRLLNNLFESNEQMELQIRDLKLELSGSSYAVAYFNFEPEKLSELSHDALMARYSSTLEMTREILPKFIQCHILSLDMNHFVAIFIFSEQQKGQEISVIESSVINTLKTLKKYYNVTLTVTIGPLVNTINKISSSYDGARRKANENSLKNTLVFAEETKKISPFNEFFSLDQIKVVISNAYEEYDSKKLKMVMDEIIETIINHPKNNLDALDLAGNILYLSISLLADGGQLISEIFKEFPDGYRSLYTKTSSEQIADWLSHLTTGLSKMFDEKKKDYKHHIVHNVKLYIITNVCQKLSLNEVAAAFGISPNYLSSLFKKNAEMGFTDFVNYTKIQKAKELMDGKNFKIYEVSHELGFESAFYFSKVFKKVEGYSPSEYHSRKMN